MDERLIPRRDFLARSLAAALSTAGLVLVACSGYGDGGTGPGNGGPCTNAKTGVVGGTHTHNIENVCQEDAGTAVELVLSGSGHTHTLSLSAAQVDMILAGTAVSATSSTNGSHSHPVDFN